MKSKINVLADYRETPFEHEVTIRCPEEHIAKAMRQLTRGFKKAEPVDTIEKGDVTVLALESVLPKFNKKAVFVTVGGELFDAEFEKALIGHTPGETFHVEVSGEDVTVTVKQATRTVYPEPTDEMAAAYAESHDEYADIKTVEAYRSRVIEDYIREQRQEAIYGTMDTVLGYVLTHSDWEFDESEIADCVNGELEYIRQQLQAENLELESLTDEQIHQQFGVPSREEMDQMIHNSAEQRIAMALWCAAVLGMDAVAHTLEEVEESLSWDFLESYVRENVHITEVR